MGRSKLLVIAAVIIAVAGAISLYRFYQSKEGSLSFGVVEGIPENMRLFSPSFPNNTVIPRKYSCDGADISPPLNWSSPPAGTKSLAILVYDPDASHGVFYHWLIYGLSPSLRGLPAGTPERLETAYGWQGINSFNKVGYGGPCPPKGETHHYVFLILALNSSNDLKPGLTPQEFLNAIKGHVITYGLLVGLYGR